MVKQNKNDWTIKNWLRKHLEGGGAQFNAFDRWLDQVDTEVGNLCENMSIESTPDFYFSGLYSHGISAKAAARNYVHAMYEIEKLERQIQDLQDSIEVLKFKKAYPNPCYPNETSRNCL